MAVEQDADGVVDRGVGGCGPARVEELQAEIAELTGQLEAARVALSRLVITRKTVAEVMAETSREVAGAEIEESAGPVRLPGGCRA